LLKQMYFYNLTLTLFIFPISEGELDVSSWNPFTQIALQYPEVVVMA
jgi:hypothetical protein